MAAKNPAAEKAAKQKKMLIVLGVLLVAVGAFQVPKLMKGSSSSSAAPETTAAADGSAATTTPAPATGTSTAAPSTMLLPGESDRTVPTATLGGVQIANGTLTRASVGQLASFSLFKPKDPFKPGVTEKPVPEGSTIGVKPSSDAKAPASSGAVGVGATAGSPATGGIGVGTAVETPRTPVETPKTPAVEPSTPQAPVVTTPEAPATTPEPPEAPAEAPLTFATISVNGAAESVELERTFPAAEPLFRLAAVKKGGIEIGIANGRLEKGKTVHLALGRTLTLVDTASGVAYVVRLITVGSQPDVTFTQAPAGQPVLPSGNASTPASPGSTGSGSTDASAQAGSAGAGSSGADAGASASGAGGSAAGAQPGAGSGTDGGSTAGSDAKLSPVTPSSS